MSSSDSDYDFGDYGNRERLRSRLARGARRRARSPVIRRTPTLFLIQERLSAVTRVLDPTPPSDVFALEDDVILLAAAREVDPTPPPSPPSSPEDLLAASIQTFLSTLFNHRTLANRNNLAPSNVRDLPTEAIRDAVAAATNTPTTSGTRPPVRRLLFPPSPTEAPSARTLIVLVRNSDSEEDVPPPPIRPRLVRHNAIDINRPQNYQSLPR